MEPAAAWGRPFEFQLAATNWTAGDNDAQVWAAPAGGLPLEYASSIVDIFGPSCSSSLQPYAAPASGGQQQLVEYNYYGNYYAAAAAQPHAPTEKAKTTTLSSSSSSSPSSSFDDEKLVKELLKERMDEFNKDRDADLMKRKMHRYPLNIQDLGDLFTVPKVVAIGPYHRHRDELKPAEAVKHVAAHHCIEKSGVSVQEMYHAVISTVMEINACSLYDEDVMDGIDNENDFRPMMFYDACFLVMYMLKNSLQRNFDTVLYDFFESNDTDIAHDIMLLENQIPWPVVDAIRMKMNKSGNFLEEFIANWKDCCLLDQANEKLPRIDLENEDYKPPHLLGLLRFYTVGKRTRPSGLSDSDVDKIESVQVSGAIELAKMGIHLTANEKTELPDMGIASKWIIFGELSMAPLSLDDLRASWLVNMAAHELCTIPDFLDYTEEDPKLEDTAVCSYLLLLCMLMHKEEDVHELREKGIIRGPGLTNKKALDFFTSLHCLRKGRCYSLVMVQIRNYRNKRPWITVYAFVRTNWKFLSGILPAIVGIATIAKTLQSLKGGHH